jgi:predicted nucleic acid-binding protein
LFISVVTMGELRRGITLLTERSARRAELERMIHEKVPSWFHDRILPVTRTIAEQWGVLDGERQLAGRRAMPRSDRTAPGCERVTEV